MSKPAEQEEASFRDICRYMFANTGTIPASVLLREISTRLREEDPLLSDIIDETLLEANVHVQELVEEIKHSPQILTPQ